MPPFSPITKLTQLILTDNSGLIMYSLRKSTQVLRHAVHLFKKKKKRLTALQKEQMRSLLTNLQEEILQKNAVKASVLSHEIEGFSRLLFKKSSLEQLRDLIFALIFALIVALLVRSLWFELYEIPSGSMRPTLKEQDRLVVSKTVFGINLPLTADHIYFNPDLVQRESIFVFTGENMDIRDVDTLYFYLFPGKKQYVKRLIGKPGDTLYFYGGQIFGIDQKGKDISAELNLASLDKIDHIPFIHFEGKVAVTPSPLGSIYSPVILYQMNEPVAKLYLTAQHLPRGEMLPLQDTGPATAPADYGDLWGFKNYAMVRLINREQAKQVAGAALANMEEGILYLEMKHHPSLATVKLTTDEYGRLRPTLGISTSLIPLQENHLRRLFSNLYTARFTVQNGFARRWGSPPPQAGNSLFMPHLADVPDGTYEFYYGKAYEVKWQGITKELPSNHPLYRFDPQRIQLLFNAGIEFNTRIAQDSKYLNLLPARYSYYREGDLYVMGAPLLLKDDPALTSFIIRENERAAEGHISNPYLPFIDAGPPLLSNGDLDVALIKQYGLTIPAKSYLALGDNHAMSADSRDFGFVPENNLRGAPDFIFWPPGAHWGHPNQPAYPLINLPRLIIWAAALASFGAAYAIHRKRNKLPIKF